MNIHEKAFINLLQKKFKLNQKKHQILKEIRNGNKNLLDAYLDIDHKLVIVEEAIDAMAQVVMN